MGEKYTIVCWKWNPVKGVPNTKKKALYTSVHVNALFQMLQKNITLPFRLICITDDSDGLQKGIEAVPLWDDFRHLGACFTRLVCFKKGFDLFGPRFMSIDLDCVITGNIDHLLKMKEDFLIWAPDENDLSRRSVDYCGSLFIMDSGERSRVYDEFNPDLCRVNRHGRYSGGSDQKQISKFIQDVTILGQKDGIYNFLPDVGPLNGTLPPDCRIVFFNGLYMPDDPEIKSSFPWVSQMYPAAGKGIKRYNPELVKRKRQRIADKKDQSITFVLFWWGNWPDGDNTRLGRAYIRKMAAAIKRHTPEEIKYRIVLFTDKPGIKFAEVESRRLQVPDDLRWNLKKMFMYSELAGLVAPVLCIDLDVVIINNLKPLIEKVWSIGDRRLITCAGAYRKSKIGGSIVGFRPNDKLTKGLWHALMDNRESFEIITKGSERAYYQRRLRPRHVAFWEKVLPGKVLSYKRDCKESLPEGAAIVRFHGNPRPHEVKDEWVKEHWRL